MGSPLRRAGSGRSMNVPSLTRRSFGMEMRKVAIIDVTLAAETAGQMCDGWHGQTDPPRDGLRIVTISDRRPSPLDETPQVRAK